MDTIVSVASPIVKRHIGYILSYKENLEKLETKVQRLEDTKTRMEHRIVAAKRNGEDIEDIVQNWMKKANDTIVEAKKLIDIEVARCCMGLLPNLWTRSQLSKRFEKMTQEISEVTTDGNIDRVSYRVASEVTITPFCRGYEALESRTSTLDEIKEALKDPKIYMIGVHGMGGVGKRTLVNELAWQEKKDGSFGAVAIATITRCPNVEYIQDQIAEGLLDQKLENVTKVGRVKELRQRIKQKDRVLIILNDIWSELDLTEVGIPFGHEHDGCKLVITSIDLNVLIKMGTQTEFIIRALREEDSWILFQKMAGDVVKEFNIKPIAEKVAKCCAGLPLLIVTVAKGLRKKDVSAWKDALIQLERFNHVELQKKVYPTLELSYNYLEDVELKSLFLFIGSLGLSSIHTGELFSCCWGLGFYAHMHTLTEARNRHYRLINDLRASSLLLDDKPEWVRMHDVVGDVAKSMASRFYPFYVDQSLNEIEEWSEVDGLHKYHYVLFPSNTYELPEKLEFPELKLLLLHNGGDHMMTVPDNFFSGIREVKTLSLYGISFTPSLPPLNLLINLRTLNLVCCTLKDIRMVGNLRNLEILNLEKSNFNELPKEIGHLTHLRLLNFACCSKVTIPKNLISSLTCLEELYMGNSCIEWEVEESKSESNNACLDELRDLHQLKTLDISIPDASVLPRDLQFLEKLERYNILVGDIWNWSLEWSGGAHETSKTLKLTDSLWPNILLTNVEDLSLAKLESVTDVLYELNDNGFPQLKHLQIKDSGELLHIINSRELAIPCSAFPNLESLVLCNLYNMEEICYGPLPTHSFEKLKVIEVKDCNTLQNLLSYSLVRNLSKLQKMEISYCMDMTEIIAMEKQEGEKELPKIVLPELHSLKLNGLYKLLSFYFPPTIDKGNQSIPLALFNEKVVMPKLETLMLYGINTCKIWDDKLPIQSCIQNLTHLTVSGCDNLTSLFSSSVARRLIKLQHLKISECSILKEIFVKTEEVAFPNLETLDIINMYDLKSIWPDELPSNSFCKLKKIRIDGCKGLEFEFVFPISIAKELQQLQSLEITHCAIENIVKKSDSCGMIHIYLEKLSIVNCPNMKNIVPSCVTFWTLDQLHVYKCSGMVNIISPSTATRLPKLRILRIGGCAKLKEIYGSSNEDTPLGAIAFMKLEELELQFLPRLRSFCQGSYDFKFRSLQMVRLNECPMMETFCHGNLTTPSLSKVHYGKGLHKDPWVDHLSGEEDHWEGDLNNFVRTIFTRKPKEDLSSSSECEDD